MSVYFSFILFNSLAGCFQLKCFHNRFHKNMHMETSSTPIETILRSLYKLICRWHLMKACCLKSKLWTEISTVGCKRLHIHHMLLKHRSITGIFRSPYHLSVLVLLDFQAPPGKSTNKLVERHPKSQIRSKVHLYGTQLATNPNSKA